MGLQPQGDGIVSLQGPAGEDFLHRLRIGSGLPGIEGLGCNGGAVLQGYRLLPFIVQGSQRLCLLRSQPAFGYVHIRRRDLRIGAVSVLVQKDIGIPLWNKGNGARLSVDNFFVGFAGGGCPGHGADAQCQGGAEQYG